jgi:tetratricopeptide (TPR) repeat protein
MSDPLRTDAARAPDAPEPDRDAKIEQLLLGGLDHYFAAEYEQAINVWTRALFLDRSHARARAYIERARSALAERQRASEELLQNGVAAFNRGDGEEARRLLEAAMHSGAPSDQALAVLDRLNRLAVGGADATPLPVPRTPRFYSRPLGERTALGPKNPGKWLAAGAAAAALALVAAATLRPDWALVFRRNAIPAQAPARVRADADLPLPLRGETALARARKLAAGGHLHDALKALEAVRPTDAQKRDADQLKGDIQRQLIQLAAEPDAPAGRSGGPLP